MTTAWGRVSVGRGKAKIPRLTETMPRTGPVVHASPSAPGARTKDQEEETVPTLEEILGDRFVVSHAAQGRVLTHAWGVRPAIEEYASTTEGMWWPCGVWTSRRELHGDTPSGARRIVGRSTDQIVERAASYDVIDDEDRTWVLSLDEDDEPLGVWCLPHAEGHALAAEFTVGRWTETPDEPEQVVSAPVATMSQDEDPYFDDEPDFNW